MTATCPTCRRPWSIDPFGQLPRRHFRVALLDPAWEWKARAAGGDGRSASRHYPTMSIEEIRDLPIGELMAPDAAVFVWVTKPMLAQIGGDRWLEDLVGLYRAWGFQMQTVFLTWVKVDRQGRYTRGTGFWSAGNPEQLWVGTRGRPGLKKTAAARAVDELMIAQRGVHSEKPAETYARIEAKVDGPYLELFSRSRRRGWTSWGNEVGKLAAKD
jgi:N6-adenosine-specific RNA methylase IME4